MGGKGKHGKGLKFFVYLISQIISIVATFFLLISYQQRTHKRIVGMQALAALLFGSPLSFVYSLAGAFLSLTVMALLKKLNILSTVGVSIAGGILHNMGQILAAMLLLQTVQIGYYFLILAMTGTISGLFIGLCGAFMIARFPINKEIFS